MRAQMPGTAWLAAALPFSSGMWKLSTCLDAVSTEIKTSEMGVTFVPSVQSQRAMSNALFAASHPSVSVGGLQAGFVPTSISS